MKKILENTYTLLLLVFTASVITMMVHAYQLDQIHDDLTTLHHEYLKSKIELNLQKLNK